MLTVRHFAWIALAEAGSFVLLLIAMVFKHGFGMDRGVALLGPIHGVLFIGYIAGAVIVHGQAAWSRGQTARIILAGIIPIAGFVVAERLMRQPTSPHAA